MHMILNDFKIYEKYYLIKRVVENEWWINFFFCFHIYIYCDQFNQSKIKSIDELVTQTNPIHTRNVFTWGYLFFE